MQPPSEQPDYSKMPPEFLKQLQELQQKRPEFKQLTYLSDIADIVQELLNVVDNTTQSTEETLKKIGAVLTDSRNQLIALNKKESPEAPDQVKPIVAAIDESKKQISAELAKIKLNPTINLPAPQVSVEAPQVTVSPSEVDLSTLETIVRSEVPKAFLKAISTIKIPPAPSNKDVLDALAEVIDWLQNIDNATRKKPTPSTKADIRVGGVDVANSNPVPVTLRGTTSAPTVTPIASSASNVVLLVSNANRKMAMFFNDSTQSLYLKLGTTATSSSYTVKMAAGSYYELPQPVYTGQIDGIWASANGNCLVTEEV